MRRYETFVIIDPDISLDQREPLISRVEELITQMDGFLVLRDDWGERKLAYDIKKKRRGYYVRFDYCGLAPLVNEIERFFRIEDRALKYMTVLLSEDVDLEQIKEEKATAEKDAADTAAAEKDAADTAAAEKAAADTAAAEKAAADTAAAEKAAADTAAAEKAAADTAAAEKAAADTAAAEKDAANTAAAENRSDFDNAPEGDREKELAPAKEKAKTDEDVPSSETEGFAAEKPPSSTIKEA
jgi:small subunit ribosomal protein S6